MEYQKVVLYWQQQNIHSSADLRLRLQGFHINFAYNSGKIENSKITYELTKSIFENDIVCNYTGNLSTLYEIHNTKDAINIVMDALDRRQIINEDFVKKIQYELTKNTYDARRLQLDERPGTYKQHDYIVGRQEVGASAEDATVEMQELFEDLNSSKITSANVVKAAAYLHCKMENIHPFSDGNGRTGRLLVNYILMLYEHPPIVFFVNDIKPYFEALNAWDERQSIAEMEAFIKKEATLTWNSQRG